MPRLGRAASKVTTACIGAVWPRDLTATTPLLSALPGRAGGSYTHSQGGGKDRDVKMTVRSAAA
ncbi:hypothetical protein [Roseicyclus elongatus]|nr:hypothetical protein [Roseibacterium elongatum]